MSGLTVRLVETPVDLEACHKIRVEVFAHEQGFPLDTEFDEVDESGAHKSWLAVAPGVDGTETPAGTIRLVTAKGKLTRLAVDKAFRSAGAGRALVLAMEAWLVAHADDADVRHLVHDVDGKRALHVKVTSQIPVIPFYARLGYTAQGDEFDEEGQPHQLMVRDIFL